MVFITVLSRSAQIHFLLYPTVSICTQAYQAIGKRNSLNNSVLSRSFTQAGPWIIATQPARNALPRRDLGF
jgi:hypothetical protein